MDTEDDWNKYKDKLIATKVLYQPDLIHPKSNPSDKWKTVLRHIWAEIHPPKKSKKKGSGFANRVRPSKGSAPPTRKADPPSKATSASVIYLPSDPNALFDRLDLLLASKQAGNTRLRNELVAICDELKGLGQRTDIEYKDLNVLINND
jgi:hypothetical protein